jgi:hypothetical protein
MRKEETVHEAIYNIGEKAFQENHIVLIQLSESNETLAGTIEGLKPYFDLGYTHVAYSDYNHVYLLQGENFYKEPPMFTKDEIDKLLSEPPNTPVTLRENLEPVALYYFTIE